MPGAVPSPPCRGRKIPSGRGQVANIRQGKESNKFVLTWSTGDFVCLFVCLLLLSLLLLLMDTCMLASKKEEGP